MNVECAVGCRLIDSDVSTTEKKLTSRYRMNCIIAIPVNRVINIGPKLNLLVVRRQRNVARGQHQITGKSHVTGSILEH